MKLRQTVEDESGVALGLALMMVVLIGVMGAGLLTTVISDLQAMADANGGQRAFEMAEAGIEVSKARLAQAPNLTDWSSGELHVEGVDQSSVVVTIERQDAGRFVATSTGQCGDARRKVEGTFDIVGGEPRLLAWREVYE